MARKKSCNAALALMLLWWCLPCIVSRTGLPACWSLTAAASACPANNLFGWWTFVLRPTCTVLASSVAICWAGRSYTHVAAWCRKWLCGQQDPCLTQTFCRQHCSKRAVFLVRYGRGGCELCEGKVENPAEFAVSILRVLIFWWRHSPTTLVYLMSSCTSTYTGAYFLYQTTVHLVVGY